MQAEFVYHGTHEQLREHIQLLGRLGWDWISPVKSTTWLLAGEDHVSVLLSIGIMGIADIAIEAGAEQQRLTLSCPDLAWPHVEPKWEALKAELGRQGNASKQKRRGAPVLKEREPEEWQIDAMIRYQDERERGIKPKPAAQLAGVSDSRTVEGWIEAWPEDIERVERRRRNRK